MEEIWKQLRAGTKFDAYYEVSSLGRVRRKSAYSIKVRKLQLHKRGRYPTLVLCADGYAQRVTVARLVAATFLGRSKKNVNHKDDNPRNNAVENLRYLTREETMEIAAKLGKLGTHGRTCRQGEKNGAAKLTEKEVRRIKRAVIPYKRGLYSYFARKYGVTSQNIRRIGIGSIWKHVEMR